MAHPVRAAILAAFSITSFGAAALAAYPDKPI